MRETEISNRLRAISMAEWKQVIKKCYGHVELRLWNKTLSGAHSEQRLGMPAKDYYFTNALKAIYEQSREWQFEKYEITVQLIRIINSMISGEVRKYKSEQRQDKQLTLLVEDTGFDNLVDEESELPPPDTEYYEKCKTALNKACQENDRYQKFVQLKLEGKTYDEIADMLNCTKADAYQLMETIARRARKILNS